MTGPRAGPQGRSARRTRFAALRAALAAAALLAGCAGAPTGPPRPSEAREFHVACTDPQGESLLLENSGGATARFAITLNGRGFLQSLDEVLQEIRALPEEFSGEPPWRKAWRYTRDQVAFGMPFSAENWYEEPCLLLNSAGFGYCDDMAELNCRIWRAMGYEARLWYLEGHVVPEVKVEGRWEMYDSTFGVYYLTPQGRVAGVEELAAHPDWILHPAVHLPDLTMSGSRYAYAPSTARIYGTVQDNRIIRIGESTTAPWSFILPPGASLRFPMRGEAAKGSAGEEASDGKSIRSWIELSLPGGWSGRLAVHLILDEVTGRGHLSQGGWSREVGKEDAPGRTSSQQPPQGTVQVEAPGGISLHYLINARRFPLKKHNNLCLKGTGLAGCKATAVPGS